MHCNNQRLSVHAVVVLGFGGYTVFRKGFFNDAPALKMLLKVSGKEAFHPSTACLLLETYCRALQHCLVLSRSGDLTMNSCASATAVAKLASRLLRQCTLNAAPKGASRQSASIQEKS